MNNNTNLEYGPVRADEIDGLNGLLEQALTFPIGNMAPWTAAIGHEYMRAVRYDGRAVADILERDFETFGAPLILRLDRATSHDVPAVHDLLDMHHVLALHGPSYYARYYGQLERQNREHREWLATSAEPVDLDAMMGALNGRWRRSTLGWSTAKELWQRRPVIDVDRNALAQDVNECAARLRQKLNAPPSSQDLSWRLAVKHALIKRGLLRIEKGGWC